MASYFWVPAKTPITFTGVAHLWCIDLDKAVKFGKSNKDADVSQVDNTSIRRRRSTILGLEWHYGGKETRKYAALYDVIGRTFEQRPRGRRCSIRRGTQRVFALPRCPHRQALLKYDLQSGAYGSPLYADGKVYLEKKMVK